MTNIAQADQSAITVALEDDVVKLRGFGQTPDCANTDLKLLAGNRGLGADLSGGHFDVLLSQCTDDVGSGQRAARQSYRIKPEAHGILALSEEENFSHARNTLQAVANINIQIVAHEERGISSV